MFTLAAGEKRRIYFKTKLAAQCSLVEAACEKYSSHVEPFSLKIKTGICKVFRNYIDAISAQMPSVSEIIKSFQAFTYIRKLHTHEAKMFHQYLILVINISPQI